jgi:hypothetical protein
LIVNNMTVLGYILGDNASTGGSDTIINDGSVELDI